MSWPRTVRGTLPLCLAAEPTADPTTLGFRMVVALGVDCVMAAGAEIRCALRWVMIDYRLIVRLRIEQPVGRTGAGNDTLLVAFETHLVLVDAIGVELHGMSWPCVAAREVTVGARRFFGAHEKHTRTDQHLLTEVPIAPSALWAAADLLVCMATTEQSQHGEAKPCPVPRIAYEHSPSLANLRPYRHAGTMQPLWI